MEAPKKTICCRCGGSWHLHVPHLAMAMVPNPQPTPMKLQIAFKEVLIFHPSWDPKVVLLTCFDPPHTPEVVFPFGLYMYAELAGTRCIATEHVLQIESLEVLASKRHSAIPPPTNWTVSIGRGKALQTLHLLLLQASQKVLFKP